jgi:hypothetical protein
LRKACSPYDIQKKEHKYETTNLPQNRKRHSHCIKPRYEKRLGIHP